MKTIKEYGFRELAGQYIFVLSEIFNELLQESFPMAMDANGFLGYCYIDHQKGMGLEVLCSGSYDMETKALRLEKENVLSRLTLPLAAVEDMNSLLLPLQAPVLAIFSPKVKLVEMEHYAEESIVATRGVVNMDGCRKPYFPDDIQVQLIKGEEQVEACYVRVEGIEKFSLYGILLEEPKLDFGMHRGDSISFYNVKNQQGIMCISVLDK